MESVIYLAAITLSQAASLALGNLRRELYRRTGAVSAYAFPGLLPLAWTHSRPLKGSLPALRHPDCPISFITPEKVDNSWFLAPDSRSRELIKTWQQGTGDSVDRENADGAVPFPVHPGVYLCSVPTGSGELPAGLCYTVPEADDFRLVCYSLAYDSTRPWFEDLTYTPLWSVHIRK